MFWIRSVLYKQVKAGLIGWSRVMRCQHWVKLATGGAAVVGSSRFSRLWKSTPVFLLQVGFCLQSRLVQMKPSREVMVLHFVPCK